MSTSACEPVLDELDALVAGNPDATTRHADHLASCDDCRDARHDAMQLADAVRGAGADHAPMLDLEARLLAKLDEQPLAAGSLAGAPANLGAAAMQIDAKLVDSSAVQSSMIDKSVVDKSLVDKSLIDKSVVDKSLVDKSVVDKSVVDKSPVDKSPARVVDLASRRPSKRLVAVAALAACAAAVVGLYAMQRRSAATPSGSPIAAATGTIGRVETLDRAAKDNTDGVTVLVDGQARPLRAGEAVPAGATVKTDDRTRISLVMQDGTTLVLDHQTQLAFAASEPRQMTIGAGRIVADVAHVEKRPASIATPNGRIDVVGTRFAVTATSTLTTVQVVRGAIVLSTRDGAKQEVRAGEEGLIDNGKLEVASVPSVGRHVEWAELEKPASSQAQHDTAGAGIGALRAYKPGEKRDRDWNLALASHDVKVRISGPVARTEITETFRNDSKDTLEGVYQFPLPADAQIDSLELDVEGGFMQGAFVDKERAAKIWRGVIDKATPKIARKPQEDIIWVQGPWRDPALLDWKRGGRFELRIFPIPANGARTIKIAYTQVVKPRGAWRQYVYPLAHSADGSTVADKFSVDVEVRGAAPGRTRTQGYQLAADPARANVEGMTLAQSAFVPRGDLVIDYRAADGDAEVRAWTYAGGAAVAPDDKLAAKKGVGNDPKVVEAQHAIAGDARPTAVIALRPKLPRWEQAKPRDYTIVVDTSQSMAGERMTRAANLAAALVGEMDRRDRFAILACDSECRRLANAGMQTPSHAAAADARTWLVEQTAAGASDVVGAIRSATTDVTRGTDRERWVIYVGDGFATTGFRKVGDVEKAIALATGSAIRVTTVGIGSDADAALLAAAARGGGGSFLAWVPGQTVKAAALASLASTYGTALRDAKIELPAGLADVAPTVLPTVRAGEEILVAARVTGDVQGDVLVKGTVAGQPFEQRYPLKLAVSTAAGNGFVPRLWASLAIEQLERTGDDRARIVALSQGYGVMSKETSLLVLESQAMFDAFGVDRGQPTLKWTGEENLDETLASGTVDYADTANVVTADKAAAPATKSASSRGDTDNAIGNIEATGTTRGPAPAATVPPRDEKAPAELPAMNRRGRAGMIAMRRSWVRVPSLAVFDAVSPSIRNAVDSAESALAANPDSREKHRALVQALAYAGEIERARDVAARWLERDKLDPQALGYQADLLGRGGQRELALRTLAGLVDLDADRVALHERMIRAYEAAGRLAQACSHRIAVAAIQHRDAKVAGAAMRCLRSVGRDQDAELVVRGLASDADRTAAEKAATIAPAAPPARGDLVVDARWTTGADLDVALIAPDGSRVSWMGGRSDVIVEDSTATDRERLAVRALKRGNYLVEVTRNGDAQGVVRGTLDLSVLGAKKSIPFELTGARATVGRVTIALEQRLDRIWMDGVSCWLMNPNTGARSKTRCP